ncbi:uncharacterized protein TRAVEDRAFT_46410 [Trametes versicolor FP-101664 SS1]|uniref:uncharacterized protein n=1 Tax=Trametes versicolor (strain FP-101664) TaxID=717944 RepID=UPI00046240A4|nr:uncharacterized protein TRAVEDRAFT_46410 [Trametes versicolor FP-101664 SS1]EIW59100.1 hypothetical protein TRAVEDRAFT_46410 [Trametes versicolor FP-101664 SS1]
MSTHHPVLLEAFIRPQPRPLSSYHLDKLGAAYQLIHGSSSKFSLSSNPNGSMARSSENLADALLRLRQARRWRLIGSIAMLLTSFALIPSLRQPQRFGDRLVDRSSVTLSFLMFCLVTSTPSRGPQRAIAVMSSTKKCLHLPA